MKATRKKAASVAVSAVALATLMGAGTASAQECVKCEPESPAADPFIKWTDPELFPGRTFDAFLKVGSRLEGNAFIKIADAGGPGRTGDVFHKFDVISSAE